MSGFRSAVEQLTEHASEFDQHAQRAGQIATTLREAIDSAGACWGDDEIGRRFAAGHRGAADATMTEVDGIAGWLRDMGGKFAATAAQTRRSDESGAEEIGRLAGEV